MSVTDLVDASMTVIEEGTEQLTPEQYMAFLEKLMTQLRDKQSWCRGLLANSSRAPAIAQSCSNSDCVNGLISVIEGEPGAYYQSAEPCPVCYGGTQ